MIVDSDVVVNGKIIFCYYVFIDYDGVIVMDSKVVVNGCGSLDFIIEKVFGDNVIQYQQWGCLQIVEDVFFALY